jgi:hypothetical protein
MKNKLLSDNSKVKKGFKWLQGLQYWIAAISYLIIFSLSILCLVSYLPHLSDADVLDTGSLNLMTAFLILMLFFATVFFVWETLQWRKKRLKKDQPTVEDIISRVNKDSNNSR